MTVHRRRGRAPPRRQAHPRWRSRRPRPDGTTSFADLQAAFQNNAKASRPHLLRFDLLHLNGHNTRNLPLRERKSLLAKLLAHADPHTLRLSEHLESDGPTIFRNACKLRAEGIVSKRAAAQYTSGRTSDWIKCKCLHEQEFVIGGLHPARRRPHRHAAASARCCSATTTRSKLIYAGRTGTGFTQKTHKLLRDKLDAPHTILKPVRQASPPKPARRTWVKPILVAQVRFATWTADNLVRQAAFLGLRDDKPATEVTRETSAPTPSPRSPPRQKPPLILPTPTPSPQKSPQLTTSNLTTCNFATNIRLTHPTKILDPESGLTKQALADYYWAVAAACCRTSPDRPLSLVRCPDGAAKPCFFQKHVNSMLPPGIGSVPVPDKKTGVIEPYITLDPPRPRPSPASPSSASSKSIPGARATTTSNIPTASSSTSTPTSPFPGPPSPPPPPKSARASRRLGLTSFLKTTGGKGLHVVIPIEPKLRLARCKRLRLPLRPRHGEGEPRASTSPK